MCFSYNYLAIFVNRIVRFFHSLTLCRFAPVAAASTNQNKCTEFLLKIKLKTPAYFPRRQKRKPKPSNCGKPLLQAVYQFLRKFLRDKILQPIFHEPISFYFRKFFHEQFSRNTNLPLILHER